jgi:hypothetical protein
MVSCAADALFVLLEHPGLLGDAVDNQLAGYAAEGLAVGGWITALAAGRAVASCRAHVARQFCISALGRDISTRPSAR